MRCPRCGRKLRARRTTPKWFCIHCETRASMTKDELAKAWKMAEYRADGNDLPMEARDMIRRLVTEIEMLQEDDDKRE